VQTFLPSPSFIESAQILDNRRLNKQITECKQIALTITDPSKGWQHHPAVAMWRGHYAALIAYGFDLYDEWQQRLCDGRRGGKLEHKAGEWLLDRLPIEVDIPLPAWIGNPDFHASHRAALLHKDLEWYGQFGWSERPAQPDEKGRLPYVWPE
jgi:hypothetical protein